MSSLYPLIRTAACVVTLPVLFTAGVAQAAENPIEEVVVTPNRVPVPLKQIGTSVAIVTAADIAAHGNLGLLDVLRQLPGMGTNANGG
ncbi:MAG: TonB-dependent receptor, partial [Pseudomonadota bacterium]